MIYLLLVLAGVAQLEEFLLLNPLAHLDGDVCMFILVLSGSTLGDVHDGFAILSSHGVGCGHHVLVVAARNNGYVLVESTF